MAEAFGYTADPSVMAWLDTAKTFPQDRARMLKALRTGRNDEIWVASLPVLAANRADMRHVVNVLAAAGATILDGATGWTTSATYREGELFARTWDYYAGRLKVLDTAKATAIKANSKDRRMPESEARTIWLDPTIQNDAMALERINNDPRYRKEWGRMMAWRKFGKSGRPPGRRPNSYQPETNE